MVDHDDVDCCFCWFEFEAKLFLYSGKEGWGRAGLIVGRPRQIHIVIAGQASPVNNDAICRPGEAKDETADRAVLPRESVVG